MTDIESRCLDAFPEWLKTLADDALALSALLQDRTLGEPVRRQLAGALNYLFKSLDLIPDGIEDLGFIDDAFVLRLAAFFACELDPGAPAADASGALGRLAGQAELVSDLLGDDYARLDRYVRGLGHAAARGRSVDEILNNDSVCLALVSDVKGWAKGYVAPTFGRDEKNLVKLKSFLVAKLPA